MAMSSITSGTRRITLVRNSHPHSPAFDTAVSHALLEEVAVGRLGETFRLYVPGRVVAFGRRDVVNQGYRGAVEACRAQGYEAVERWPAGGPRSSTRAPWRFPGPSPPTTRFRKSPPASSRSTGSW